MTFDTTLTIYLLGMSLLAGACDPQARTYDAHLKLHSEIAAFANKGAHDVELEVSRLTDQLLATYRSENVGDNLKNVSDLSSFYVPKSAPKSYLLKSVRLADQNLDKSFEAFQKKKNITSWHYVYDSDTKSLHIYPKTNPYSFFGEDLTFDSFSFFKLAVEHYPRGAWGELKEDMKGTGKIIIFSKAITLKHHKAPTVMGFDLHVSSLFKPFVEKFLALELNDTDKHVVFYAYIEGSNIRDIAYEFTTDPQKWKTLRPVHNTLPNIAESERAIFHHLQEQAGLFPGRVFEAKIQMANLSYLCSVAKIPKLSISTFLCNEL
jgi:hypothetical protein